MYSVRYPDDYYCPDHDYYYACAQPDNYDYTARDGDDDNGTILARATGDSASPCSDCARGIKHKHSNPEGDNHYSRLFVN